MKKIAALLITVILVTAQSAPAYGAVSNYAGQLTKEEKQIYNNLYQHFYINNANTDYLIEWNTKSESLTSANIQKQYDDLIRVAYSALINDHPEYYWANTIKISYLGYDYYNSGVFSYSELKNNTISMTSGTPHKKSDIKKFNKAIKKAVKKINKYAGKNPGRAKRLKAINKWICNNTKYDSRNGNSTAKKYEYLHNAYGVFVKKKAVCDGYAAAFKVLCDYYKIPCMINLGYAYDNSGNLGAHAWNLVKVKKHWYIIDSTWNDTNNSTKWLMCGSKTTKNTHLNSRDRLDICGIGYFKLPAISKKNYK